MEINKDPKSIYQEANFWYIAFSIETANKSSGIIFL